MALVRTFFSDSLIAFLGFLGLFFGVLWYYNFDATIGVDLIHGIAISVIPGIAIVHVLNRKYHIELTPIEQLSLGSAVGFGLPFALWELLSIVTTHARLCSDVLLIALGVAWIGLNVKQIIRKQKEPFIIVCTLCSLLLLWFAFYNLHQFQLLPDGSIETRQVFGTDVPFLIGEVHGIRNFSALRDLHQSAQRWFYHDATYRLIAQLPEEHTIENVIFTVPLIAYTAMLLAVFAVFRRLTTSNMLSALCMLGFFMIGSFSSTEKGIYAVSPSLVIGTAQTLAIVLLILIGIRRMNVGVSILILAIMGFLSQTKLSAFLCIAAASFAIGVIWWRSYRMISATLIVSSLVCMVIITLQAFKPNPLMPGSDFILGFPLFTYAQTFSNQFHFPLSSVSPITDLQHVSLHSVIIVPLFAIHLIRWVATDLRLLVSALMIVLLWKQRNTIASQVRRLWEFGIVTIVASLLLPVLYSPAWYPDALSFYTPLVSMQLGLLLMLSAAIILWQYRLQRRMRFAFWGLIALCLFGTIQNIRFHLTDRNILSNHVSPAIVSAMRYFAKHSEPSALLATRRYDTRMIDTAAESYFWYGAISGRSIGSEGARYGAFLAATAPTDSMRHLHPVQAAIDTLALRRTLLDTIYYSTTPHNVAIALAKAQAGFVLEDLTIGQRLSIDPQTIGSLFYSNDSCRIWKIRGQL
jgi:hypothetical protein